MNPGDLIGQAADLAERIVEEIATAEQDWGRVAAWARQLAEVAERIASANPEG